MRCRKARWYLSARCDGTLSERQRLRLEAHLACCEECRREAFYFGEIGALTTKVEARSVRPDFDLRLKAAIRRAEEQQAHPTPWWVRAESFLMRPALAAATVMVLGIGGLVSWNLLAGHSAPMAKSSGVGDPVSRDHGLANRPWETPQDSGRLIPVDLTEARLLEDRYRQVGEWPRDYIMEYDRLDAAGSTDSATRYVLPIISTDQVTKKEMY